MTATANLTGGIVTAVILSRALAPRVSRLGQTWQRRLANRNKLALGGKNVEFFVK